MLEPPITWWLKFPPTPHLEHQPFSYFIQGQCTFKIPSLWDDGACDWLECSSAAWELERCSAHVREAASGKVMALDSHPCPFPVDKTVALFLNHGHCYFPKLHAQQLMTRKKGSLGSPPLLPAIAWQPCPPTDVARRRRLSGCWGGTVWVTLLVLPFTLSQGQLELKTGKGNDCLVALSGAVHLGPEWCVSLFTQGLQCQGHPFQAAVLEDSKCIFLLGGFFRTACLSFCLRVPQA